MIFFFFFTHLSLLEYDTGKVCEGDFGLGFPCFFITRLSLLVYDTGEYGVGDFGVRFLFFLLTSLCLHMILE